MKLSRSSQTSKVPPLNFGNGFHLIFLMAVITNKSKSMLVIGSLVSNHNQTPQNAKILYLYCRTGYMCIIYDNVYNWTIVSFQFTQMTHHIARNYSSEMAVKSCSAVYCFVCNYGDLFIIVTCLLQWINFNYFLNWFISRTKNLLHQRIIKISSAKLVCGTSDAIWWHSFGSILARVMLFSWEQ